MIQAGLYSAGTDPAIDLAVKAWPHLDALFGRTGMADGETAFAALGACFDESPAGQGQGGVAHASGPE